MELTTDDYTIKRIFAGSDALNFDIQPGDQVYKIDGEFYGAGAAKGSGPVGSVADVSIYRPSTEVGKQFKLIRKPRWIFKEQDSRY